MNLFHHTTKAAFLSRPNRFTLICQLDGNTVKAFLPNPGRMWELLLPGSIVHLEGPFEHGEKMLYKAVAVERGGRPVMVDTHRTNELAKLLIDQGRVPGLEGAGVIGREFRLGRSRFDFLLQQGRGKIVTEVKSCTLFGREMAMFPDAVTARGRRHVEELCRLSGNLVGAVLFIVHSPRASYFLPDYHTDLAFARAFLEARGKVKILPLAVDVGDDLALRSGEHLLDVPWEILKKEAGDRGSYILILRIAGERKIDIGKLGKIGFRSGYYLYAGSARKNLSQRMARHRRLRKNLFWHVDYLREAAEFRCVLPIRTRDDLECKIARQLRELADWEIPRFGASDCSCPTHLYGMTSDPLKSPRFISLLLHFRMDRLTEESSV